MVLAACGQEQAPPVRTPTQNKVKVLPSSKQNIKQLPDDVSSSPPPYVYDPTGLRDPFEALVMIRKPVVNDGMPLTPLQKYDLSQFRLTAVVVGKNQPVAMVVAPGGKAYVLKTGVKIGKNGGVVTKVSPEVVYVEEKYYDFTGKLSTTSLEIRFTQKAGDN
jgi:type IV pilus assembly protein PilP